MVATKKQKYKEIPGTRGTTKKTPDTKAIWCNMANMSITELGLKILEKTAKKAY